MNSTAQALQQKIDTKTKPLGSLGELEWLALQVGTIQNTLTPVLSNPTVLVFAADHGVASEGVSAYPSTVTAQMVLNFLQGGAAVNVFCKQHNIKMKVIDAGVNYDFPPQMHLIHAKIAKGTRNYMYEPAMTEAELNLCFTKATKIVDRLAVNNCNIVGFGEMGIGNTSSASLLMSHFCDLPLEQCVGRGTGLNDEQLQHKLACLLQAQQCHADLTEPKQVLAALGGFEIVQMTAAMLAAYQQNMILLIDGFIASSAFLAAKAINPDIQDNAIFCHLSDEQGHQKLLAHLGVRPVLKLGMRLGEGSGCALAYPLVESAVTFLNQMASFESANVSQC
ncbi:nicotinate-nucleotide--dimethylbenzimidazole phosphoribosyltransferase [Candidatus Albibeggiatoa sp. nov. NOAA]|uniref:nicotinate-nucleotide--dimethylbenzimidazole phosphoribosyltransferase n=1 Tax=Candidatus Albibeggiatoa sp. nov. NOAA TaxID=3162724 RepID=UPI0032FCAC3E|nr:nicotinate-nucleotide--dimethylbenzimidazole phosphoribosyltransferase [Thiotrichaceae bacterium]